MATHALPSSTIIDDHHASAAPTTARRPSRLRRFYTALIETQRLRARRDLERILGPSEFARRFGAELPPEC